MRALERVVLVAILAAGGAAPSAAQGPTTYDACYVPGVGAVYLIKQPGLPATCLAPTHLPISWTTGELADGSVTEVKLAFDPSTQAELDAFVAALAVAGVINTAENPVDWTQLKNVPADFADGVDNTGGTPTDLVCPGCVETTDLADAAVTAAKLGDGSVTEVKLAFDPSTQAELDAFAAALAAAGVINTAENPVDWTQLKNVPADFADGVDDAGGTPTDLVCPGCVETTDLADAAVTTAKLADGGVTEVKLAFDPSTQAELDAFVAALAAAGVINAAENPVDWTQLKNVPADFADGVDDAAGGVADHGALTGLVDDDHPQYLLAGVRDALNGFAVTGNFGSGTIPATGAGTRLMWYPAKAAFRAGHVLTQWDDANIGAYSTAMGESPTASAPWSTAIGVNATASGSAAVAMGFNTTASGGSSVAMGNVTTASGASAVAIGNGATASGGGATALGGSTTASGNNSTAMGLGATASGALSTAIGHVTTAQAYGSLAIGRFNVVAGNQTQWLETDPLFVAGNGASDAARSNALTLYKDGNLDLAGTLTAAAFVGDGSGLTNLPGGTSSDLVCTGCVETTDLADAAVSEAKLAFDPSTQAELDAFVAALAAAGVINTAGNPVDWTQLKNVPADFADGVDDVSGGVTDHGALAGLADDDHPQYLLAGVRDAPDGFAVTGPINTSGTLPVSGAGARLMWYPRNASFRAGSVTGTQWDTPGAQSAAFGWNTTASGNYSLAAGGSTTASGPFSTALGQNTVASGSFATALGNGSTASDQAATAMGFYTSATAQGATALGWSTTASGQYATALGVSTTASGARSTAMGGGATAAGDWATAAGNNTTAQALASFAIGRYNVVAGDATQWLATDPLFVAGNGTGDAARSNALTLYKNGNLDLAGTLTAAAFVGDGSGLTNLPGVADHGGLTGLGDDDHPQYLLAGVRDATDGFAVTGMLNTGTIPATGAGTRLMWYPAKSAFRAGTTSGTEWDATNVGQGSVAIGTNTIASGILSIALGGNTTASGHGSAAMGNGTTASGSYATAMGWGTMAQGDYATSLGMQSAAVGDRSTALGDLTGATGYAATSMGSNTVASGAAAIAMGAQTTASGETSTAMGSFTAASGHSSAAMGTSTTAQAFASLVIGRGNVLAGDPLQWLGTDPLFVAGNGTPAAPSNALTLYKNGNLDLAGTLTAAAFVGDGSGLTNLPGVTDHGGLTGLGNDDHPQYLLAGMRDAPDGFAVTGTFGTGTIPTSGTGTRLMWYTGKAAFRAGYAFGTNWDTGNVGDYSAATGYNNIASGAYSVAAGFNSTASATGAIALGTTVVASGAEAVALGVGTTASNGNSTAMGNLTSASGYVSTAFGGQTTASNNYSTAMGFRSTASGVVSTAIGEEATAQARTSLVIGRFNVVAGSQLQWLDTDPLLVAGNGADDASRSNALTLFKNGNLTIAGTLTENSDIRLKQEIEPLGDALTYVLGLTPIRYRFRDGTGHPTGRQIGLSAQDVRTAFPELVSEDSQGYLSVAYANLTAVLVRAMQEQQAEIDALKAEVAALHAARTKEAGER